MKSWVKILARNIFWNTPLLIRAMSTKFSSKCHQLDLGTNRGELDLLRESSESEKIYIKFAHF